MHHKLKGVALYSEKEKLATVKTIFNAYFPFKQRVDFSKVSFTIATSDRWLYKLLPVFNGKKVKYHLIAVTNQKQYKAKLSVQEMELLLPILMGYGLYKHHSINLD